MKYVKTFESFSNEISVDLISHFDEIYGSEITNEGLVSWIKSKFKLKGLQKGFDAANKLISDDSKFKAKLEEFAEKNSAKLKKVNPEEVKKLTGLIKGEEPEVEKKMEAEAEKMDEADNAKTFTQRFTSFLKSVLRFGGEILWVVTSVAGILFAHTEQMGARTILSGEAMGNTQLSGAGFLMTAGAVLALIGFLFYKVMRSENAKK